MFVSMGVGELTAGSCESFYFKKNKKKKHQQQQQQLGWVTFMAAVDFLPPISQHHSATCELSLSNASETRSVLSHSSEFLLL